jgi:hypothetical protein
MKSKLESNEDGSFFKDKKYPKLLYRVLLSKLETQNRTYVIRIERDDGKTLTANSYHVDEEYLADEENWM